MSGAQVGAVLTIMVQYPNAELVPKIETAIWRYGSIAARLYLDAPDKNGRWITRAATYLIIAKNLRVLKISLTQIQNHENVSIFF